VATTATAALLAALCPAALTAAAPQQGAAPATAPKPLLRTAFASGEDGWKTIGEKAKTTATDDDGRKALKLDYTVEKGALSALYLPVAENEIGPAKSVRFSVKADRPSTLACVLQEKDGGRYIAAFYAPGDEWQSVALAPSDFLLAQGDDDPDDPDGKLDMERVESVGVIDVGQLFVQGDPKVAEALGATTGARRLLLGEFTVGRDPLPASALPFALEDGRKKDRIDTFRHPQVNWIGFGGASLSFSSEAPLTARGLKARYERNKGLRVGGVMRAFPRGFLAGRDRLDLTLASEKPVTLIVQIEGKGGAKHNALLYVPGGGKAATTFSVPFSSFKRSEDSKVKDEAPTLDDVYQILLLDVTALLPAGAAGSGADALTAAGPNTLWVADVRAAKGAGTGVPPAEAPK
jgi:hypothetical protein